MTVERISALIETMRAHLADRVQGRPLADGEWVLSTPFFDGSGDPISFIVSDHDGALAIDDAGIVAGHLFSLGQHPQDTPAYRLLDSLSRAHNLDVDFDKGVVRARTSTDAEQFVEDVLDLAKVVMTVITATPYIKVRPRRMKLLGPRLRSRIKQSYGEKEVLSLVEADYEIAGHTVEAWPVDFHWRVVGEENEPKDIYVVAADLDVADPLSKAQRISALALDTRISRSGGQLRIVIDTHGSNSDSDIAASFVREYGGSLQYSVYDYGQERERDAFIDQSASELLGDMSSEWRGLWLRRRHQ